MSLVEEGRNLTNDIDEEKYCEKLNLKSYDAKSVNERFKILKKSVYAENLGDEVLEYVSHLYELGYFDRIGNPKFDEWLALKNIFEPNRETIPKDTGFSLLDLIPLENGIHAIRNNLLMALKW